MNGTYNIEKFLRIDYHKFFHIYEDFDYSVDVDMKKTHEECAREILNYVEERINHATHKTKLLSTI